MATILFSALGALFGPIGGAVGTLVGRAVDGAIFGGGGGNREGPRLKDLSVTTSSYGTPIPRHFGKMRASGTIIWSTELVEHKETHGNGKGQPSTTTYSYTVSLAVALSSRPILGIGRIWADGNLIRGEAGDLKPNGTLRLYTGEHDQPPDPLLAQAEGAGLSPAYRGLAYAVFEDLDLSDFYNRIPALSFEVFADDGGINLQAIVASAIDDADADLVLTGLEGFSCEGPLTDTLDLLEPLYPIDCDSAGTRLTIARERLQSGAIAVGEAAISVGDGDFGGPSGFARKRAPQADRPPEVLRYYEVERDYQPGVQRSIGRPLAGQPRTIELPAAITAENARMLAARMAKRDAWARQTLSWRTAELDPAIAPGALVTAPGQSGSWRVKEWEWRASGVELTLARVTPTGADAATGFGDPGRFNPPPDLAAAATALHAFELPWDGSGSPDTPALFAAVSSSGRGWTGAALFADEGDGALQPLGPSGRSRCIMGNAVDALATASPHLVDRENSVLVQLLGDDMLLADAGIRQLALGANRALLGEEIIQFGRATALGSGRWRLERLVRGRGGTESASGSHAAGEAFVLLDGTPVALDAAKVGDVPGAVIAALGRIEAEPVVSPIALRGITLRPLSPVHPRATQPDDGGLELGWTRRARGAWTWSDGVDAPLREQLEAYLVTYGPLESPVAVWEVNTPGLTIDAAGLASLASALPGDAFRVRQRGTHALSDALVITHLT